MYLLSSIKDVLGTALTKNLPIIDVGPRTFTMDTEINVVNNLEFNVNLIQENKSNFILIFNQLLI